MTARRALHLNDYTAEELRICWFSDAELEQCKDDVLRTVELVSSDAQDCKDNEEYCLRGTEHRTREGHMKRQRNKKVARAAVMREQEAQWESGLFDDEAIAVAYRNASAQCVTEARMRAQRDMQEVLLCNFGASIMMSPKVPCRSVSPRIFKGCPESRRHALSNAAA